METLFEESMEHFEDKIIAAEFSAPGDSMSGQSPADLSLGISAELEIKLTELTEKIEENHERDLAEMKKKFVKLRAQFQRQIEIHKQLIKIIDERIGSNLLPKLYFASEHHSILEEIDFSLGHGSSLLDKVHDKVSTKSESHLGVIYQSAITKAGFRELTWIKVVYILAAFIAIFAIIAGFWKVIAN